MEFRPAMIRGIFPADIRNDVSGNSVTRPAKAPTVVLFNNFPLLFTQQKLLAAKPFLPLSDMCIFFEVT